MPKTYSVTHNVGNARHVVNYHDGVKAHADGSPFHDVAIFGNAREMEKFCRSLEADGYTRS